MRGTICDVCERAPAKLFCAADEAALCCPCDDKVHKCNKLASRHLRVVVANPSESPRCDICENAPAFFYCEIDGSCMCLQCDMIVHAGGKRAHERYLLLRQKVLFPGDKPEHAEDLSMQPNNPNKSDHQVPKLLITDQVQNHEISSSQGLDVNGGENGKMDSQMFDLNTRPCRTNGEALSISFFLE